MSSDPNRSKSRKGGKRKIGRQSRKPAHNRYTMERRWETNKARKAAKVAKQNPNFVASYSPKNHLGVSNDQNLHFGGAKNCKKLSLNAPKSHLCFEWLLHNVISLQPRLLHL